ncbi:hypothetical protein RF11_15363 [Thelohanellus kitauei]|uniref:Uncharacterized protein n=1 Tax=Thelohanellus kitauei TaxID=669202 RepID=A0A0C2N7A1_THEKT|nr:hypothetical protein RF11_15363 [Thelohanellus kitauei]
MPRLRHSRDMPPDPTSLSTPSHAIGAGLSGPGKHRAGRKVLLRQLMARLRSVNLSKWICGKREEAGPHLKSSGYKSPEDRKVAKGLRLTARPLAQLQSYQDLV